MIGCCGNTPRISIGALLEAADALPASTPQGIVARRRLAYAIAAGKAAQAGNRSAYAKAMRGFEGLGLTTASTGFHTAVSAVVTGRRADAAFQHALNDARTYITLVTTLASAGTSIARIGCHDCDVNAINVIDMVISWVNALVSGAPVSIPPLTDPGTLAGFLVFCGIKETVKGAINLAFTGAIAAASGDRTARNALMAVRDALNGVIDGICAAVAANVVSDAPPPPPPAPDFCSGVTNATGSDGAGGCTCGPGTVWSAGMRACLVAPGGALGPSLDGSRCPPGSYNLWPPAGLLTATGAVVPGTAGRTSCRLCQPGNSFVPGTVDARGQWATPPQCIPAVPGPCPAGQTRGADGTCRASGGGGGGGGGGLVIPAAAAFAFWKLFF